MKTYIWPIWTPSMFHLLLHTIELRFNTLVAENNKKHPSVYNIHLTEKSASTLHIKVVWMFFF